MIEAILFDFNGVIIDDERIHLKAYREVFVAEGVSLSDEEYFPCLGMDDAAFVRAAFARAGRPLSEDKMRVVIDHEHELHRAFIKEELPISLGVVTFIKAAARNYQLGIVSMAERREIDHVLQLASLLNLFSVFVSAEPGLKHKPAPDGYQRALELLNEKRSSVRKLPLQARECLVIEDAPPGIQAARAAGMRTIGLTNTVSENDLRAAGADIVTASLADWSVDAVHHLFDYGLFVGRTIVIGDIHGCFDELTDLLELVKLRKDDRVVAVGDLIVKGPKNQQVLDLFIE